MDKSNIEKESMRTIKDSPLNENVKDAEEIKSVLHHILRKFFLKQRKGQESPVKISSMKEALETNYKQPILGELKCDSHLPIISKWGLA